jgi:hypothetical protein
MKKANVLTIPKTADSKEEYGELEQSSGNGFGEKHHKVQFNIPTLPIPKTI